MRSPPHAPHQASDCSKNVLAIFPQDSSSRLLALQILYPWHDLLPILGLGSSSTLSWGPTVDLRVLLFSPSSSYPSILMLSRKTTNTGRHGLQTSGSYPPPVSDRFP